jgi:hypothetical protein
MKSARMKNSSNKNKEHTSIVDAVVNLLDGMKESPNNMSTSMNMLFLCQMERTNDCMDKCERKEDSASLVRNSRKRRRQRRRPSKARPTTEERWATAAVAPAAAAVAAVAAAVAVAAAAAAAAALTVERAARTTEVATTT